MSLQEEIANELISRGTDFVSFVDISQLPDEKKHGFKNAVLIGIVLSPKYLQQIIDKPDFVEKMKQNHRMHEDEFHLMEKKTDGLADFLAEWLTVKGYPSFSQSEQNLFKNELYDGKTKNSALPHKTIATLAGLGWIGKHNLLVTPEFGSAISMCTVLTIAHVSSVINLISDSQCGSCNICVQVCHPGAIKGKLWNISTSRDEIIDVNKCITCLKCMVFCPHTQAYKNNALKIHRFSDSN